jgi:hypothetical protein
MGCSVPANPEENNAYCDAEISAGKHNLSVKEIFNTKGWLGDEQRPRDNRQEPVSYLGARAMSRIWFKYPT